MKRYYVKTSIEHTTLHSEVSLIFKNTGQILF